MSFMTMGTKQDSLWLDSRTDASKYSAPMRRQATSLCILRQRSKSRAHARAAIQKSLIANKSNVIDSFESRDTRAWQGIRVFDQTFAITYAVEAISIVVAVGGVSRRADFDS